ncbi:MAG TPA: sugar phosphate isomerase/epimerase family protein [Planctomycetota bacterium]|nr:sugar phosphate isomerase/epimerase family protein [Planctomycetota bacterium]
MNAAATAAQPRPAMLLTACYLYTIDTYGYPPSIADGLRAIDDLAAMGFRFIELEGVGEEHIRAVHATRARTRDALERRGMRCVNFCPVLRPLMADDAGERRAAYDVFRLGAETAAFLGAPTVHVASYLPPVEFIGPRPYVGALRFGERYQVRMPDAFSWARQWDAIVESIRACADIAHEHGLTLILEPRVAEMVSGTDAMLRLMDWVERDNFRANFDCAHLNAQKEILPISARKLAGRIAGVHLADNDGTDNRHLFPGDGNIDFEGVLRELHRQGFAGSLGIDLGSLPDLGRRFRDCAAWLRERCAAWGIPLDG